MVCDGEVTAGSKEEGGGETSIVGTACCARTDLPAFNVLLFFGIYFLDISTVNAYFWKNVLEREPRFGLDRGPGL